MAKTRAHTRRESEIGCPKLKSGKIYTNTLFQTLMMPRNVTPDGLLQQAAAICRCHARHADECHIASHHKHFGRGLARLNRLR